MELSNGHFQVIRCLRDYYVERGPPAQGRALGNAMEDAFGYQGGKKYLYRLFPIGPVAEAGRLAGLPLPPYTVDTSFGSVH